MPRFAILTHDHPFWHWDLLLEKEASLRAWRLLASPDTPGPVVAEGLPDHRLLYLTYEGPVSGDRGAVRQWDAGEYQIVSDSARDLCCDLQGRRLNGRFWLREHESGWSWEPVPQELPTRLCSETGG